MAQGTPVQASGKQNSGKGCLRVAISVGARLVVLVMILVVIMVLSANGIMDFAKANPLIKGAPLWGTALVMFGVDRFLRRIFNFEPELLTAVKKGDIEKVKTLLAQNTDLEVRDDKGITPLHVAFSDQSQGTEMVELLLNAGFNVNVKTKDSITPLHNAVLVGRKDVVTIGASLKTKFSHSQRHKTSFVRG